jgi:hypothetical protein
MERNLSLGPQDAFDRSSLTGWNVSGPSFDDLAEDGAAAEIDANFRRRLFGLRRLPRHLRAAALRAASDERCLALRGLREKRQRERQARYALWRQQLQSPRPSG